MNITIDDLRMMAVAKVCRSFRYRNSIKAMALHRMGVITKGELHSVMIAEAKAVGV